MNREFRPLQAEEIACSFLAEGVEYLFIGKSGAILLGSPGTTQDVDVFPARLPEIFAPDGINNFAGAKARGMQEGIFYIANVRDIIASKRASGRKKDEIKLPLLENFRVEYEQLHAPPLHPARDIAEKKSQGK